jgi:magnesium transporter
VIQSKQNLNEETYVISKFTRTYLRDVSDHLHNILASFDSFDETARGLVDLTFNSLSHSTNEGMKILAVVSLTFLPLTLLCGIYGMNFDYFPELHTSLGFTYFWILASVSLAITLTICWYMRWLSSDH